MTTTILSSSNPSRETRRAIVRRLFVRQQLSLGQIARRIGVSKQTVMRDVRWWQEEERERENANGGTGGEQPETNGDCGMDGEARLVAANAKGKQSAVESARLAALNREIEDAKREAWWAYGRSLEPKEVEMETESESEEPDCDSARRPAPARHSVTRVRREGNGESRYLNLIGRLVEKQVKLFHAEDSEEDDPFKGGPPVVLYLPDNQRGPAWGEGGLSPDITPEEYGLRTGDGQKLTESQLNKIFGPGNVPEVGGERKRETRNANGEMTKTETENGAGSAGDSDRSRVRANADEQARRLGSGCSDGAANPAASNREGSFCSVTEEGPVALPRLNVPCVNGQNRTANPAADNREASSLAATNAESVGGFASANVQGENQASPLSGSRRSNEADAEVRRLGSGSSDGTASPAADNREASSFAATNAEVVGGFASANVQGEKPAANPSANNRDTTTVPRLTTGATGPNDPPTEADLKRHGTVWNRGGGGWKLVTS